jgi:hypothetical protein
MGIDGQADAANRRITDALGTKDTEPEPGGGRRRQREGILNAAGQRPERPGWGREGAASWRRRPCPSVRYPATGP